MGLEKGIAWHTAESLPLGHETLKIQRQSDGFDLLIDSPEPPATQEAPQKYTIRWKEATVPNEPKKAMETVPEGEKAI